jgi:predicted secreted protein
MLCSLTLLAAPAPSACGEPDITGTWATKVAAPGTLGIALGDFPVNVQTTLRLNITKSGSDYVHKIEICKLATPSTPDPATLAIQYRPALLQTMVGTRTAPAFTPSIGGPVTIPQWIFHTGANDLCYGGCAAGDFVDSDRDSKPGITLPASLYANAVSVEAYAALTVAIELTGATLTDAETITGNGEFYALGQFHSTNNPGYPANGTIDLHTATPSVPVTIKKIGAGDVACSTVLQQVP